MKLSEMRGVGRVKTESEKENQSQHGSELWLWCEVNDGKSKTVFKVLNLN